MGSWKTWQIPPQILPQVLGLGKKNPLALAGKGRAQAGEAPAKTLPVLAAGEQTPSPGRSQQVSVLHSTSNHLPAWANHWSTSSLGSPGVPNCSQPGSPQSRLQFGVARNAWQHLLPPQALPAGPLCKLRVLSPSRNAPNLQYSEGVGACAPLVTHLPSRWVLGPCPKILPAPPEPSMVYPSWFFPPE